MKKSILAISLLLFAGILTGCTQPECQSSADCPFQCDGKGGSPQVCSEGSCATLEIYQFCEKDCGASCETNEDCPNDQFCNQATCECEIGECSLDDQDGCDTSCSVDADCKDLYGCGCLNKEESCDTQGAIFDLVERNCICENGNCITGSENVGKPKLDFSSGPCNDTLSPYDTQNHINSTLWTDYTTLQVNAIVVINCDEEIDSGNFNLEDNKLTLSFDYTPCGELGACALCMCPHELTYTLSNMEKRDYDIILKSPYSTEPVWASKELTQCAEEWQSEGWNSNSTTFDSFNDMIVVFYAQEHNLTVLDVKREASIGEACEACHCLSGTIIYLKVPVHQSEYLLDKDFNESSAPENPLDCTTVEDCDSCEDYECNGDAFMTWEAQPKCENNLCSCECTVL
ncbi:hypothetical protein K8R43_06765 [archaeon]|nr:hypothetical protein [archaeon]